MTKEEFAQELVLNAMKNDQLVRDIAEYCVENKISLQEGLAKFAFNTVDAFDKEWKVRNNEQN